MTASVSDPEAVISAVTANPEYAAMLPELVRNIACREISKGRSFKETVKATRTSLHQIGGAYLPQQPPFTVWAEEIQRLPSDKNHPEVQAFCLEKMKAHASTRERLPHLQTIYKWVFSHLPAVHSILDLACGLNPLAIPWMNLAPAAEYHACDIYPRLTDCIDIFCKHLGIAGNRFPCDLTVQTPREPVQVAFLLKSIPCLEQLKKGIMSGLIQQIHAEYLVISFPAFSLSGRDKGMQQTYRSHFFNLASQETWQIKDTMIGNELLFLLHK